MKPLQIDSTQKEHLLEMCQKLFPEWHTTFVDDDFPDNCLVMYKKSLEKTGVSVQDLVYIHWFEFCMTHLMSHLFYNLCRDGEPGVDTTKFHYQQARFLSKCIIKGVNEEGYWHPVDYLYEQYKKLKLF